MPATSKAQQRAAGAALAAKRGEASASDLQGASRQMHDGMTEEELAELASTELDDLPGHVADEAADEPEGHPT